MWDRRFFVCQPGDLSESFTASDARLCSRATALSGSRQKNNISRPPRSHCGAIDHRRPAVLNGRGPGCEGATRDHPLIPTAARSRRTRWAPASQQCEPRGLGPLTLQSGSCKPWPSCSERPSRRPLLQPWERCCWGAIRATCRPGSSPAPPSSAWRSSASARCSLAYPAVFLSVGAAALWAAGRPLWSRPELPKSRLLLGAFALYLMLYFFNCHGARDQLRWLALPPRVSGPLPARARLRAHHQQPVCRPFPGCGDVVPVRLRVRPALRGVHGAPGIPAGAGVGHVGLRPPLRLCGRRGRRLLAGVRQSSGGRGCVPAPTTMSRWPPSPSPCSRCWSAGASSPPRACCSPRDCWPVSAMPPSTRLGRGLLYVCAVPLLARRVRFAIKLPLAPVPPSRPRRRRCLPPGAPVDGEELPLAA